MQQCRAFRDIFFLITINAASLSVGRVLVTLEYAETRVIYLRPGGVSFFFFLFKHRLHSVKPSGHVICIYSY